MTLNSVFDLLQRGAVNGLALPYFAIEEEILAEQGMTRQDLIEFEKKVVIIINKNGKLQVFVQRLCYLH